MEKSSSGKTRLMGGAQVMLVLLLMVVVLLCIGARQAEAGFFDKWNKKQPAFGGGYVQPYEMGR